MTVHLIAYTAKTADGTEQGVARVRSPRPRPSWQDCHQQIDGFFTGKYLGIEPQYTISYATADGPTSRTVSGTRGVEIFGRLLARTADRGDAWNIAVTDDNGQDVTYDFACFCD
ncbi:hypothetical protein [Streptomyces sp. NPDC059786]|uniref:hypothetical protein n=1 Tax=Streptomyces sp. NPDC059786 TaxID=3346946 RepID=UPI00364B4BE7